MVTDTPTAVTRFRVDVADAVLRDLRDRLARTRWPEEPDEAGWDYGTNLAYLQRLVHHWRFDFDWRAQERRLNAWPHYRAQVHAQDTALTLHFLHVRGRGPHPFPLILTHGWPSSFAELLPIIGPLTDPEAHGGSALDAFDVVVPSLPGFGFSEMPRRRGWVAVEEYWRALMTDVLGYKRFGAHGTDVGARVTSQLGRRHGDVVAGIHIGSVDLEWPEPLPDDLSTAEQDYIARVAGWNKREGGYAHQQETRPQTLAFGLNDSPVGLAAWLVEKFRAWSDGGGDLEQRFSFDELLTSITLYWATQTIGSSMRRYFEAEHRPDPAPLRHGERIETPTAIAMFPGERDLVVPRSFAARCYNLVRWTDMPRGGHFVALEEPALLVDDLRAFFRTLR